MNKKILISILLLSIACEEETMKQTIEKHLPRITLEKFILTETDEGKKKWTLSAVTASVFEELIIVDTVQIKFFNAFGKEYAWLKGNKGELNTRTHNIIVRDSVVLITEDSTTLFTDSLFWNNGLQVIITDAHVKIVKKDSTVIEGNGLKTTPDLQKIEIIGDIKGASPITFPKIR
ncbi:MAG: LPS export ABC transporter periplasmic protein LptC [candidate division WOR-3 bacterium]|nr:LPS export ABC transporter periplasmic protein LptC [candidate division WOR-3 bacterium]